ncbi:hypothetical protein NXS19_007508 [Fusarium pseudograminearum]|nr:hypothetical protein NXS19_007508 [Fusarium pseudograminearum]
MGRVPIYIADPSVTPELLYVPALRNPGFRDDPSTDEYRSHGKLDDHRFSMVLNPSSNDACFDIAALTPLFPPPATLAPPL